MRLFWKIYLLSFCSVLFCAVLVTVIVSVREAASSIERLRAEQRLLAITAASQVETGYYDQVWPFEMLSGVARGSVFVSWEIVNGEGRVVLSSATAPSQEVRAMEKLEEPALVERGNDHEYWIVPLRMRDNGNLWQFRLEFHTRAIREQLRATIAINAAISLGLAVLFIGASLLVTHRFLRPLDALTRAVGALERGNLEVSLPPATSDELGRLVVGFGAMVESIKQRDAQIQDQLESLELARAELELRVEQRTRALNASEARTRAIIEHAADAIIAIDELGRVESCNPAAIRMFGHDATTMVGKLLAELIPDYTSARSVADSEEWRGRRGDGELFPIQIAIGAADLEGSQLATVIVRDISEQRRAEAERRDLWRQAGMADVAVNVLHNVGNVLNSVNVSVSMVRDQLAKSRMTALSRVTALLEEHAGRLGEFFDRDPQGARLPQYLALLDRALVEERRTMAAEIESLGRDVGLIENIVRTQQRYAKNDLDVSEVVDLDELIGDVVRIAPAPCPIAIVRKFDAARRVKLDRYKMVNALVNLVNNAAQATDHLARDARVEIAVEVAHGSLQIEITDNGVGIAAENLVRIFNHGFTTRADGHGFGLHSAALSITEMGGSIVATSAGEGCGAQFRVKVPIAGSVTASIPVQSGA
jgi:two-component system, NtrC family, sensor kinase